MKYYFVISPKLLENVLTPESKRLMKEIYNKKVTSLYYRIKTKQQLDNPRRLFIKGDGQVIETEVKPHISLVHNIEPKDIKDFITKAKNICIKHNVINLEFDKVGNHDMDFTFYVGFKNNPDLHKLRLDLLKLSRPLLTVEEYNQHIEVVYVPHATVLYDDIDPKKVNEAYKKFNIGKFKKTILVQEVLLWEVTTSGQNVIAKFPLNRI